MEFFEAVKTNNVELVKKFILEGFDPSHVDNEAIVIASENGYGEIVQILLDDSRVNPRCQNDMPIYVASYYGRTECVRNLLLDGRADPTKEDNICLFYSLINGHHETAKLLLRDNRVNNDIADNERFKLELGELIRKLRSEIRDDKIDEYLS